MHCPRCGQQQVSAEIKYCSRCGFPLGLVSEIVAHGGYLPQLADLNKNKKLLTRKNGLKFGLAWFLVWMFIITPVIAIAEGDALVAVSGVVGIMGGILMMIFSLMFLPKEPKQLPPGVSEQNQYAAPQSLGGQRGQTALPPQKDQPVSDYMPPAAGGWKAPETGEFAQPGSVTDGTTKLFNKED